MGRGAYIVITPVRNEESHFPRTIASFVGQTLLPARWIIVDDGSSDQTGRLADAAAAQHPWIEVLHRPDRGHRKPGGGVMEAFYDGFARLSAQRWDYVAKIDGDIAFPPDYFRQCLQRFECNARLGIGGGLVCQIQNGALIAESPGDPTFHVRGNTKIYRHACWEQIGGLVCAPGWDTIDELKANMLGWETATFPDLKLQTLKETGSADGVWRNWIKNGLANYIAGYHPLFMLAKCLRRAIQRPYGIVASALWWGYCQGWIKGVARVPDAELIRYVRRQQLNKLLLRSSLW